MDFFIDFVQDLIHLIKDKHKKEDKPTCKSTLRTSAKARKAPSLWNYCQLLDNIQSPMFMMDIKYPMAICF